MLPNKPITLLAISSPAPVLESADASESVPPKRNIVFKSIDCKACFSVITPVTISAKAPIAPVTHNLIPILSSNIIPSNVRIRITKDVHCFHFGTLLKSLDSSKPESAVGLVSGNSLCPNTAKNAIPAINIGKPTLA